MTLDTGTFQLLQNALAASNLRQSVYANNIANVDTPGYKRQDVSFESMLQQQLASTDGSGLTTDELNQLVSVQPQVVTDTSTAVQNNGNNVDVDAEMSELAANQIRYNALVQDVDLRILRLREAIQGE
ncbi:flagellar basal body rod protein FlgB [Alicyclobacillus kakegawensis]|uniref:flagellar basal body rod protein FlgB n=1 Tax=Alicyclobacillus kakegawensis TaxID=392012 RepID=UPI000834C581|nr:flagellar basal body rod protein FlgB [Alicyclobacillus kakegawensis]